MKNKIICIIIIGVLLFASNVSVSALKIVTSDGNPETSTVWVNKVRGSLFENDKCFSTITEAINYAKQTFVAFIMVSPGDYHENLVIENLCYGGTSKSITWIIGSMSDPSKTRIIGDGSSTVIEIKDYVEISGFTIMNGGKGITVKDGHDGQDIDIWNNIFKNNGYGIYIADLQDENQYIDIDRNNFIGNTIHAYDNTGFGLTGRFTSGINGKGNYWDNYTGVDEDGDGIGDIPYKIGGGNHEDTLPLMKPYGQCTSKKNSLSINNPFINIFKRFLSQLIITGNLLKN